MPGPLLALLAAATPAPAVPARPPFWRVDWAETRCILARDAGEAGPSLAVRYIPGDRRAEIWLLSPNWTERDVAGAGSVTLVLDAPGVAPIGKFRAVKLPTVGYALATDQVESDFFYALPAAGAVSFRKKGREFLRIPIPDAARALAATRDCEDDLLKRWGVDPVAFRALKSPPVAIAPLDWFSPGDYPPGALRRNEMGKVYVRVNVSAEGRVTACDAAVSSGSPDLDKTTCALILRKGRFRPAIGANGRPVASLTISYVTWLIAGA